MAELNYQVFDKTLEKVNEILILETKAETFRHYLGMSEIGDECVRKLFYNYRYASEKELKIEMINAANDGHYQEFLMSELLKKIPDVTLITIDQDTKKQIEFTTLLGHLSGHVDGMILGIAEAPKTWHVWEHKSVNEKKFNELIELRNKNEKNALKEWDYIYYIQAQSYMHFAHVERHFLTVSTPGGRARISIRTEYAGQKFMENIIEKAKSVIFDNLLPSRLSDNREFYKCKWCQHQAVCHDNKFPLIHCKTCKNIKPIDGGKFYCEYYRKEIPKEELFNDCQKHVYNSGLIQTKKIHIDKDGIIYQLPNGTILANYTKTGIPPSTIQRIDFIYSSRELLEIIYLNNIKAEIEKPIATSTIKAWERKKTISR